MEQPFTTAEHNNKNYNKSLIVGLSCLSMVSTICAIVFGVLCLSNRSEANVGNSADTNSSQLEVPTTPVQIPENISGEDHSNDAYNESSNTLLKPIMISASDALNNDSRFAYITSTAIQAAFGYESIEDNGYTARIEICEDGLQKYYQYSTGKGCEFFNHDH